MFTEIKYTTIMEGRKFTSPLPTGRQAKSLSFLGKGLRMRPILRL